MKAQELAFRIATGSVVAINPDDLAAVESAARVLVDALVVHFTQKTTTGGVHTSPLLRLILLFLAKNIGVKRIIETGYDCGVTTEALAASGAQVIGVDNLTEYPEAEFLAQLRAGVYPNVELRQAEALDFLRGEPDASACLIFIDDLHDSNHVRLEAVEARRIIRPGGIVAFHDTRAPGLKLWSVVEEVFPDWERFNLPAISPDNGIDYGLGIVRRPE